MLLSVICEVTGPQSSTKTGRSCSFLNIKQTLLTALETKHNMQGYLRGRQHATHLCQVRCLTEAKDSSRL